MRFAFLLFVAAVSCSSEQAYNVEKLIQIANALEAPFTPKSLKRMEVEKSWGAARANRSTDVVIFNPSNVTFHLKHNSCVDGGFTSDLLPESIIPSRQSSVFGTNSDDGDVLIGVSCVTPYYSSDQGSWFSLSVENLAFDGPYVRAPSSQDISVAVELDQGFNNQARFIVSDNKRRDGSLLIVRSSHQQQRQPKRAGNVFVKASKSGSGYRTI